MPQDSRLPRGFEQWLSPASLTSVIDRPERTVYLGHGGWDNHAWRDEAAGEFARSKIPMNMTILVCACGKRVRAPGARPGRVGRCPACGRSLEVPTDAPFLPGEPALAAESSTGAG